MWPHSRGQLGCPGQTIFPDEPIFIVSPPSFFKRENFSSEHTKKNSKLSSFYLPLPLFFLFFPPPFLLSPTSPNLGPISFSHQKIQLLPFFSLLPLLILGSAFYLFLFSFLNPTLSNLSSLPIIYYRRRSSQCRSLVTAVVPWVEVGEILFLIL